MINNFFQFVSQHPPPLPLIHSRQIKKNIYIAIYFQRKWMRGAVTSGLGDKGTYSYTDGQIYSWQ